MFDRLEISIGRNRSFLSPTKRQTSNENNRKNNNNNNSNGNSLVLRSTHAEKNFLAKKRVIKMLAAIVFEFFFCWCPLYILILSKAFNMWDLPPGRVYFICYMVFLMLAYGSSCCNPITYCFMNRNFRQAFLVAFGCKRFREAPNWTTTVPTWSTTNVVREGVRNPMKTVIGPLARNSKEKEKNFKFNDKEEKNVEKIQLKEKHEENLEKFQLNEKDEENTENFELNEKDEENLENFELNEKDENFHFNEKLTKFCENQQENRKNFKITEITEV